MNIRSIFSPLSLFSLTLVLAFCCIFAGVVSAWSGPAGTAPNNNVSAPLNVGGIDQIKDAGLGVNSFAVYGNQYVQGSLGVGVIGPDTALGVAGTIKAIRPSVPTQFVSISSNAGSGLIQSSVGTPLELGSGASSHLAISTAGNVGVGTTTATAKLDVYGDTILSGASRYLNFGGVSGTNGYGLRDNAGTIQVKNSAGSWTSIPTSGTTQWTTAGNNIYYTTGNVGVGTVNPGVKLQVMGSPAVASTVSEDELILSRDTTGGVSFQNVAALSVGRFDTSTAYPNTRLDFKLKGTYTNDFIPDTTVMSLLSNGKVGIGTVSPTNDLTIVQKTDTQSVGGLRVYRNNGSSSAVLVQGGDNNTYLFNMGGGGIKFYVNGGTEAVSIGAEGRMTLGEAGGAYSFIAMKDDESPGGLKYIHANSNQIGFLNSAANTWLGRWDNAGNQVNTGNISATAFVTSSDARLKKDVKPLTGSLEKVLTLQGISYKWKDTSKGTDTQIGFIAQEVEKIAPELVTTGADGFKSIDYSRVTPLLVEAIKGQQQEIDELRHDIEALKAAR